MSILEFITLIVKNYHLIPYTISEVQNHEI